MAAVAVVKVRLFTVMSAPSVEPVGDVVTVLAEKMTSVFGPGTTAVAPPVAAVTQLLAVVPFEAAQTVVLPVRPPVQ